MTPYCGMFALLRLPQTDGVSGKDRPVLLLRRAHDHHPDWLVCMTSSRLHQAISTVDEVVTVEDPHFGATGLKVPMSSGSHGLPFSTKAC